MVDIDVQNGREVKNVFHFRVEIRDETGRTQHDVTLSKNYHQKLVGEGDYSPPELVEASFRFLLEREPKESILRSFDLSVIGRYFSDYEDKISRYLEASSQ